MHDPVLEILDNSLVAALGLFVLICCGYLAGSAFATYGANRKVLEGLRSRFQKEHSGCSRTRKRSRSGNPTCVSGTRFGRPRYGALWSLVISCAAFLFLSFSPWPTMKNFANLNNQPPLRVTFLMIDPTDGGFRFEGDVWNQSDQRVPVQASIILLDDTGAHVGGASAQLAPEELAPRDKGQFVISLNAPAQATSFTLHFADAGGQELAYAKGFPNEPEAVYDPKTVHRLRGLPRLKRER